jgi:hypothetical protein
MNEEYRISKHSGATLGNPNISPTTCMSSIFLAAKTKKRRV